jgi:hypothetical protein
MTPQDQFALAQFIDETFHSAAQIGTLCFIGIHLTCETSMSFKLSVTFSLMSILSLSLIAKAYQKGYMAGLKDNPNGLLDIAESLRQRVVDLERENKNLKEEYEDYYGFKP